MGKVFITSGKTGPTKNRMSAEETDGLAVFIGNICRLSRLTNFFIASVKSINKNKDKARECFHAVRQVWTSF